ncbi:MAG: hypothetical protein LH645_11770 [Actinomycetia bacterium]|nr:hypothetical protein [Actinomycetes bacterium]
MSSRRWFVAVVTLFGLCIPTIAFAGTASLDPTFSVDGKLRLDDVGPRGSDWTGALDVVNGNTYVLGTLKRSDGETGWYLARFLPGGQLDPTYGDAGVAVPPLYRMGGLTRYSFDLFVSDDGSAVVSYQNFHDLLVTRWTSTGRLDESFSGDGIRYLAVTSNRHFSLSTNVTVDNENRVVVAGTRTFVGSYGYGSELLLYRLLATGQRDDQFSQDRKRVLDDFRRNRPTGLATDSTGRILVAGYHASPYGAQGGGGFLYRFTHRGALDDQFSQDGFLAPAYQGAAIYPLGVEIGADGTVTSPIAIAGGAVGGIRLGDDGTRDRTYGDSGVAAVLAVSENTVVAVDNGRVVVTTHQFGNSNMQVVTVNRAGSVIRRYLGDLFSRVKAGYALDALDLEGDRITVGARWNDDAYLARVSLSAS